MAPSIQRYVASVSGECDRLCPASPRIPGPYESRDRSAGPVAKTRGCTHTGSASMTRSAWTWARSPPPPPAFSVRARKHIQTRQSYRRPRYPHHRSHRDRALTDRSLSALRPHHRHPNLDPHRQEASPRPRRIDGAHTPVRAQQLYQRDTLKCWLSSSAPSYDDGCWPPCCYPSSLSPCSNSALSTAPKRRCTRQSVPGAVVDIEVTRRLSSGRNDDPEPESVLPSPPPATRVRLRRSHAALANHSCPCTDSKPSSAARKPRAPLSWTPR